MLGEPQAPSQVPLAPCSFHLRSTLLPSVREGESDDYRDNIRGASAGASRRANSCYACDVASVSFGATMVSRPRTLRTTPTANQGDLSVGPMHGMVIGSADVSFAEREPDRRRARVRGRLVTPSLVRYIPRMRRLVVRLVLLVLAVIALSADTAVKFVHGIAHQREARDRSHHGGVGQGHGSVADETNIPHSSIDAIDVDADHLALHGVVTATVGLTSLMTVAVIVELPIATTGTESGASPRPVAQAAPPWSRARPSQPRAPPVG